MPDTTTKIDPITLELVGSDLGYTVREMRSELIRMSYSPILYETHDFSCAIANQSGEIAAMNVDVPHHIFPVVFAVQTITEKFGFDVKEGDVYLINDPYLAGTHLNDVLALTPFMYKGEFQLFICIRVHYGDVGGVTPGSASGEASEIFHEGVRIPAVKVYDQGQVNQGLLDLFFANLRQPYEAEGVFTAQIAVAELAKRRLTELFDSHGAETVQACVNYSLDNTESRMRERLRGLPDGEYFAEDYFQDSGTSPDPVVVKCKMEIDGDSARFDFTGSSPEVPGVANSNYPVTWCGVFNVMQTMLGDGALSNTGAARAMSVHAPKGTVMNPEFPMPVGGAMQVLFGPTQGVVLQALSQVMAEDVSALGHASSNATNAAGTVGRFREDKYWLVFEFACGGWPATAETDGPHSCYQWWNGDLPIVWPVERLELLNPAQVEFNQLYVDSGGPGNRRGGVGLRRAWKVLTPAQISVMGTDSALPRLGMSMGMGGAMNWVTVLRDGEEVKMSELPMRVGDFRLEPDDLILTLAAGGAGYGDPLTRPVESVLADVQAGYVTVTGAAADYGVVIADGAVDQPASEDLRLERRQQRLAPTIVTAPEGEFDEFGRRLMPLSGEAASRLGVGDGDIVEYVPEVGAPVRAWARIDEALDGFSVRADPRCLTRLRCGVGDAIWIREPWTYSMREWRRNVSPEVVVS
jgi:N-methylhydantoinase B